MTSLMQVQPLSLARSFFMLAKLFSSPSNDGKSYLKERNVPSKTRCWQYALPCNAEMTSSI